MDLQQINLIVGKNATGKSRTMNVIAGLARFLSNPASPLSDGTFKAYFLSDLGEEFHYSLQISEGKVATEAFARATHTLLDRSDKGEGRIWAEQLGQEISFQTPQNMIAALARQDAIQHPFLDQLLKWAQGVHHYRSSGDLGKNNLFVPNPAGIKPNLRDVAQTAMVFNEAAKMHGAKFKDAVLKDMRSVGYDLIDIGIATPSIIRFDGDAANHPLGLWVKERDISVNVDQISMSDGMFRALALLIHINLQLLGEGPLCFLVDDIGEGLDFDRSSALLHAMIARIGASSAQIIMTTNDRYVMNGVDLDYWTVLSRTGGVVSAFNSKNRASDFEDFKFTGLNNFDLLARDYLSRSK